MLKRFGPARFYKEAFSIALPVMMQAFVQSMVSLVDNFMVAGLGDVSMASVNVANQVNFIYLVFINTICQAGGIYMSQYSGAKDARSMQDVLKFKILFLTFTAAAYFVICQTLSRQMVSLMTLGNAERDGIIEEGARYIRICSFSLLPMALSFGIGTSFREIGNPKVPMIISAIATVVNTIGNFILIYGNFGAPTLGTAGAAYATNIARVIEAAVYIVYMVKTKPPFYMRAKELLRVNWTLCGAILKKSLMLFVSEMSWVFSETIMTALYNGRGGAETVAGMAAGWTIANVLFMVLGGTWTACSVIIGRTLGAGDLSGARKKAVWLRYGSLVLGGVVALLGVGLSFLLIPLAFARLSVAARTISLHLILVILAYLPFWALLNTYFAITRSGGDAFAGMIADLIVNSFLFLPAMFIFALLTPLSPVQMYAIAKVSDFAKLLIVRHFYNKEKWVRNLTTL